LKNWINEGVLIDKSFEKDTDEITDKKLLKSLSDHIKDIQKFSRLSDIKNCKKLKGSKNAYRIKIGNYRIGFIFENQTVQFIRFLHRNKVYDFFPG
jgi:mRNA interferase RelE/StbE